PPVNRQHWLSAGPSIIRAMSHGSRAMPLILLPGLDGTGRLFDSFVRELPDQLVPKIYAYAHDEPLGYGELERKVTATLPTEGPFAIVAESFSGPLAIRIAARAPPGLVALVLVASFVRWPLRAIPAWLGALVGSHLRQVFTIELMLRSMLLGFDAEPELVRKLSAAVESLAPGVLASRIAELATIDVTAEFRACPVSVLYLQGTGDRLVSERIPKQLLRLRPDMRIAQLAAPHLVLQRQPAA